MSLGCELQRLVRLARHSDDVCVLVDDERNAEDIGRAATAAGVTINGTSIKFCAIIAHANAHSRRTSD